MRIAGTASIGITTAFERRTAMTSLAMIARITAQFTTPPPRERAGRRRRSSGGLAGAALGRGDARLDREVDVLERRGLGAGAVDGQPALDEQLHQARDDRSVGDAHDRARRRRDHHRHAGAARSASAVAASTGPPRSSSASRPCQRSAAISSGRPNAWSRPRWRTAIRSARRPASPRKWVASTTVRPCSVASEPIRSMTSRVAVGSRPEVGSSRNSTSGSWRSARARARRLRCPVEVPCTCMVGPVGHAELLEELVGPSRHPRRDRGRACVP